MWTERRRNPVRRAAETSDGASRQGARQIANGDRLADQRALGEIDAKVAQREQGRGIVNRDGGGRDAKGLSNLDKATQHRAGHRIFGKRFAELRVDFQTVGFQAAQITQGGCACAKIAKGGPDAKFVELRHEIGRLGQICDRCRLGHFKRQAAANLGPGLGQKVDGLSVKGGIGDRAGGQINPDHRDVGQGAQVGKGGDGKAQDGKINPGREVEAFGEGQKQGGQNQAMNT